MRKWILLLFTAFTILGGIQAQEPTVDGDTITISLLTCEPHDEVYSLYGHTALRFRSTSGKLDWAVNYGAKLTIDEGSFYATGVGGGDNIQVPAGKYDCYLNDITGQFAIVKK